MTNAQSSLSGQIIDAVGSDIASGTLPTGATMTLGDISAQWGVSRTVAREAMRALEQLGMIASSRRTGLTVLPLENWQVFDRAVIAWRLRSEKSRAAQLATLNDVRLGIEPIAARAAARLATPRERADIRNLARRLGELHASPPTRVGDELATDLRFHAAILRASHNEMFAALSPNLLAMLKGRSIYGSRKRDPVAGTVALHADLAAAIDKREPAAAEDIARRILEANRPPAP